MKPDGLLKARAQLLVLLKGREAQENQDQDLVRQTVGLCCRERRGFLKGLR